MSLSTDARSTNRPPTPAPTTTPRVVVGPQILLRRTERTPYATFGRLEEDRLVVCATIELPYLDRDGNGHSDPDLSCLPPGEYWLFRRWSPKHKCDVFGVESAPGTRRADGRTDIEIHWANWAHQLKGCIAVGTHIDLIEGERAVINSRATFEKLMLRWSGIDRMPFTILTSE